MGWATEWQELENPCFSWQVASKSSASVAHQTATGGKSHGDLREFSRFFHYLFTRKAHKQGFSGRAAREKRLSSAIAAPTALRPRATCPTCHSGICHGISVYNSVGSVAVSKRGRGRQRAAYAVVATLWGDYFIPTVSHAWGTGCWHGQTYRIKQGQSKRPSSGSGLVLCPCLC